MGTGSGSGGIVLPGLLIFLSPVRPLLLLVLNILAESPAHPFKHSLFAIFQSSFFASGSQGLFLKKPPLDPAKTFPKGPLGHLEGFLIRAVPMEVAPGCHRWLSFI
jgi:hypothetical protein